MKHYTPLPSKVNASNSNDVEQQTKISDEPRLPFGEYLGRHFDVLGAKITDIIGQDVSLCNNTFEPFKTTGYMIVGASLQSLVLFILGCMMTIDFDSTPQYLQYTIPIEMPTDDQLSLQSRLAITGAISSVIIILGMRIAAQIRGPEVPVVRNVIIIQYLLGGIILNPLVGLFFGFGFWACLLYSFLVPISELGVALVVYSLLAFMYWVIYP